MHKKKTETTQKSLREYALCSHQLRYRNQYFIFNTTINNYHSLRAHAPAVPSPLGGTPTRKKQDAAASNSSANRSFKEESHSASRASDLLRTATTKTKPGATTFAAENAKRQLATRNRERFMQKTLSIDQTKSAVASRAYQTQSRLQTKDKHETAAAAQLNNSTTLSESPSKRELSSSRRLGYSNRLRNRAKRSSSNAASLATSRRANSAQLDTSLTSASPKRSSGLTPSSVRRQGSHQTTVRVVARIRPPSKMETSLMNGEVGGICFQMLDESTIHFPTESQTFSLDAIFDQTTTQAKIYENVGKATIEDVLNGYNGTIFAYGQTGSGKTYTMFGSGIFDEQGKGIIPRASVDIFRVWEASPDVREVEIRCSMLEIYKENLRDLLTDDVAELKIKESPNRGIYVEGLCEFPIACPEELMYYLEIGEARRVWAETRHNAVSSRSHTIFILEVRQILANESEKRGILNLVDLAGSEKVGKSGAQGQIFAEGTKINLSLSALGNVIHALSTGLEHVPYRDSKLTRLLQESLGGNYKTSLIVTCSPHSSQLQETLSTLKFAQRAKKLKNKVQMNIKNSPDMLLKMIEQLKLELQTKELEIQKMHNAPSQPALMERKSLLTILPTGEKNCNDPLTARLNTLFALPSETAEMEEKRCRSAERFEAERRSRKNTLCGGGEGNKATTTIFGVPSRSIEGSGGSDMDAIEGKLKETDTENERLRARVKELTIQLDIVKKEKGELEIKLLNTGISLADEKRKAIAAEKQTSEVESELNTIKLRKEKTVSQEQGENVQIKVLKSQLKALSEALEDSETECFKLLKEKKERNEKETIEMCALSLTDFVSKDTLYTSFTDKWVKDLDSMDLGMAGSFVGPKRVTVVAEVKLDPKQLMSACKYAEMLGTAVEDGYVSPETLNYLLRNQVIDAAVMNHNLKRVVSLLVWKLQIERSTAYIKNEMCKVLQKSVDSLEDLLGRTSTKHQAWKKKVEKLDYEIEQLREQLDSRKGLSFNPMMKTRIRKPISKLSIMRQSPMKGDIRGVQTGMQIGFFQQIRMSGPQRKISCQTLGRSKLADDPRPAEDSGEPQVLEMNEEEELKLQQDIDNRYKGLSSQRKKDTTMQASPSKGQKESVRGNEQLEANLQEAQIELEWHKTLADLLMAELVKTREQAVTLRNQISDIKASSEQAIQDENRNWQLVTNSLKENCDKELARKQKDIIQVHELLAQWIMKYMDLEKAKGLSADSQSLKSLLKEYAEMCEDGVE